MSLSPGGWQFRLAYEIAPIVLTGGIAQSMPGGALPIIALLQAQNYSGGLLNGIGPIDPDNYFARFRVQAGGTIGNWQYGTYPFANQAIAANAVIFQPLEISLLMICPATTTIPYSQKQAIMGALKTTLAQHASLGGLYTVATPAILYDNLTLGPIRDVSTAESEQPQIMYQWDFTQPLVTLAAAQAAQNALMSQMSAGTQVSSLAWSGVSPTVGNSNSLALPSAVPSAAGTPAANTPGQSFPTPPIPPSSGPPVTVLQT